MATVDYHDPAISISGRDWGLGALCVWTLSRGADLIIAPESLDVDEAVEQELVMDALWELVGNSIESVEQSKFNANDPVFHFSGGYVLRLCADSDFDPWTMKVGGRYFVGSMT